MRFNHNAWPMVIDEVVHVCGLVVAFAYAYKGTHTLRCIEFAACDVCHERIEAIASSP